MECYGDQTLSEHWLCKKQWWKTAPYIYIYIYNEGSKLVEPSRGQSNVPVADVSDSHSATGSVLIASLNSSDRIRYKLDQTLICDFYAFFLEGKGMWLWIARDKSFHWKTGTVSSSSLLATTMPYVWVEWNTENGCEQTFHTRRDKYVIPFWQTSHSP